jgi:uncharacterized membrane protein SirB2
MSYYDQKTIHVFLSIVYLCLVYSSFYQTDSKVIKIFSGIFTLLVLVSGVSMMNRLGLELTPPYPMWIVAKFIIWLTIGITTPIVIKRAKERASRLFIPYAVFILVAVGMSIYKPY